MNRSIRFDTPAGPVEITATAEAVTSIRFGEPYRESGGPGRGDTPPLLRRMRSELEEYFAGTRRTFTVPLAPAGTDFQRKVWAALRTIPYGETRTYGQIAVQIGNPKAARAVGMANNRNPIAIAIPCHRVIGGTGALTGYAAGLEIKAMLLELERAGGDGADGCGFRRPKIRPHPQGGCNPNDPGPYGSE